MNSIVIKAHMTKKMITFTDLIYVILFALKILAKELDVSELNSLLNSSAVFSFWGSSAPSPAAFANALFPASSLFPSLNRFISSGEFFIFSSMLFSNCFMSILILGISAFL